MPSSMPILFILTLIGIFIFRHHLRKSSKTQEKTSKEFWDKERSSLVVRKKELEPSDYVKPRLIPDDLMDPSFYETLDDPSLSRLDKQLRHYMVQPMVNFQHISNADIRLTFGTAMLTTIEAYEENWNQYINTLFSLGKRLMDVGEMDYGCKLLEEGIHVGTDNRHHYMLLADYYHGKGDQTQLEKLYLKASELESLTKDSLMHELSKLMDSDHSR